MSVAATPRLRLCALLVVLLVLPAEGCFGGSKRVQRFNKAAVQESLKKLETPGLLIGEFPLAKGAIVDGDTVKVSGLNTSLRLLHIDTEETFKSEGDRRLYETGWQNYLKAKKGDSNRPIKGATPLGEEAKHWAERYFEGVERVRIERDHPKELRGRYNRYLAYVFALKEGRWVNYNIECVRAGMSPYFTKYGYSNRFHDQFVEAQREAQTARRGIWDPKLQHYPDYAERLEWWNARADFMFQFDAEGQGRENYVVLTQWDAVRRLEALEGKEVVIFGLVGEIQLGDRGPTRVLLSRRLFGDFPLIFFDKDVFGTSGISRYVGEYVKVRGVVTRYQNKFKKRSELQIVVSLPGQVSGAEQVPNYQGWDIEGREAELDKAEGAEDDNLED